MKKIALKTKILVPVFLFFGIAGCVLLLVLSGIRKGMYEQQANARWSGERPYAQLSAFWLPGQGIEESSVYGIRQTITNSLADTEAADWARYDAFSSSTELYGTSDRGSVTLRAVATGGDFFRIHEHRLLSGNYYADSPEYTDCCILDEDAAWVLFGAVDVAGMTFSLEGHTCVVCGVIQPYDDAVRWGKEPKATVYLPFDSACVRDRFLDVTCYEAVLPDPILDFAKNIFDQALSGSLVTVENSRRFDFLPLWETLTSLTGAGERSRAEVFPFWENAALKACFTSSLLLAAALLSFLFCGIAGLVLLSGPIRKARQTVRKWSAKWKDKISV